jgi:hypothetical protein
MVLTPERDYDQAAMNVWGTLVMVTRVVSSSPCVLRSNSISYN